MTSVSEIMKRFISELERLDKYYSDLLQIALEKAEKVRKINKIVELIEDTKSDAAISFYRSLINNESEYMEIINEHTGSDDRKLKILEHARNIVALAENGLLEEPAMETEVTNQCLIFSQLKTHLSRIKADLEKNKTDIDFLKEIINYIRNIKEKFSPEGIQNDKLEDIMSLEAILKVANFSEEEMLTILAEIAKNNYEIYYNESHKTTEEHNKEELPDTIDEAGELTQSEEMDLCIKAEISEALQREDFNKRLFLALYPVTLSDTCEGADYGAYIEFVSEHIYNEVKAKNIAVQEAIDAYIKKELLDGWSFEDITSEYSTEEFDEESAQEIIASAKKFMSDNQNKLEGITTESKQSYKDVIFKTFTTDAEREDLYQQYKEQNLTNMAIILAFLEIDYILHAIDANNIIANNKDSYFALCNRLEVVLNTITKTIAPLANIEEDENKKNILFLTPNGKERSFFESDIEGKQDRFFKSALNCIKNLQERDIHKGSADRFPNLVQNKIKWIANDRARILYKLHGNTIIIIGITTIDGNDAEMKLIDTRVQSYQEELTDLINQLTSEASSEILSEGKRKLSEIIKMLEENSVSKRNS